MDNHTKELIDRSLDGDLNDAERSKLESRLSESEEARAYQQEMSKLVDYLENTESEQPPEGLARSILGRVDLPHPRKWFTWAAGWMQGRPVAYGTGAALGLMAAVALYELTPAINSPQDMADLVGTVANGTDVKGTSQLASLAIEAPGVHGTASLETRGDLVYLNLDLSSEDTTELHAQLPDSGLNFEGFSNAADEAIEGFLFARGNFSVANTRTKKFSVIFSVPEGSDPLGETGVQLLITQNRDVVYRGVLNR